MGIVKINQAEAQVGVEVFFGSTALRKIKKLMQKKYGLRTAYQHLLVQREIS